MLVASNEENLPVVGVPVAPIVLELIATPSIVPPSMSGVFISGDVKVLFVRVWIPAVLTTVLSTATEGEALVPLATVIPSPPVTLVTFPAVPGGIHSNPPPPD